MSKSHLPSFYLPSLFLLASFLVCATAHAQLVISNTHNPYVIDFDNTVAGVNNGKFAGTGFQPAPEEGQLDSDAWASTGLRNSSATLVPLDFGGTRTGSPYNMGVATGAVGSWGYSALDQGGNRSLLVQPAGGQFAPGSTTLRIQNNSGAAVTGFAVSYLLYCRNDFNRGGRYQWSWDTSSTGTFANILNTYLSPTTADANGLTSTLITGNITANIANGGYLYLRWTYSDADSIETNRDEFAMDNITVMAVPEPNVSWLAAVCLLSIAAFRRSRRTV